MGLDKLAHKITVAETLEFIARDSSLPARKLIHGLGIAIFLLSLGIFIFFKNPYLRQIAGMTIFLMAFGGQKLEDFILGKTTTGKAHIAAQKQLKDLRHEFRLELHAEIGPNYPNEEVRKEIALVLTP